MERYTIVTIDGEQVLLENTILMGATASDGSDVGAVVIKGGIAFTPLSYDADLTMDGTAQAVALATGALKVKVVNRGVTTEAIRVVFGESILDAQSNLTILTGAATTGDYLPSSADQGDGEEIYGVPANATHYAIANAVAADTQIVSITQGV